MERLVHTDKPILYVTNHALIVADNRREAKGQLRQCSGNRDSSRVWSIMANPRSFEVETAFGFIACLTPKRVHLEAVQSKAIAMHDYRVLYEHRIREVLPALGPGDLCGVRKEEVAIRGFPVAVESGDTLFCSCSREQAEIGWCHRVGAAGVLLEAGWRIILDGKPLLSVSKGWTPVFEGKATNNIAPVRAGELPL